MQIVDVDRDLDVRPIVVWVLALLACDKHHHFRVGGGRSGRQAFEPTTLIESQRAYVGASSRGFQSESWNVSSVVGGPRGPGMYAHE